MKFIAIWLKMTGLIILSVFIPVLGNPITLDTDYDTVPDVFDVYPNNSNLAFNTFKIPSGHYGTLAFEDLWPNIGDYDINDLLLKYNWKFASDSNGNLKVLSATFYVIARGAGYHNGFGIELIGINPNNIMSAFISINNASPIVLSKEDGQSNATFILFKDTWDYLSDPLFHNTMEGIETGNIAGFVVEIELKSPVSEFDHTKQINPFIYRTDDRGLEVHLADFKPTDLADTTLFGTMADTSNPSIGRYYKTSSNLPWAIDIPANIRHPYEKIDMTIPYPNFVPWAESGGMIDLSWYKTNVNETYLYPEILLPDFSKNPHSIIITSTSNIINIGDTLQLTGTVYDKDNNVIPLVNLTWYVDPSIGTIDKNGLLMATNKGTGQVMVKTYSKYGTIILSSFTITITNTHELSISEFQAIRTNGSNDFDFFEMNGHFYLAVANDRDKSRLYIFNNNKFDMIQEFDTTKASKCKFFNIENDLFLFTGNYSDFRIRKTNSKIYKFNGSFFVEFQNIQTIGNSDCEFIKINNDYFLAITNYRNDNMTNSNIVDSKIYKWDGSNFNEFQTIQTYGAVDCEFFQINNEFYLGIANISNFKIYKFDENSFVEFQETGFSETMDLEFFEIEGEYYLGSAGSGNATIYKWNGTNFVQYQENIQGDDIKNLEFFEINGEYYLGIAKYADNASKIMKWNQNKFNDYKSFNTKGAKDLEFFEIDQKKFLSVSNFTDGSTRLLNSMIFSIK